MRFEKWQALGNDYLIVERDELPFELTPARVRLLCEGHFGVFADGVLLLSPPADPAHVADLRIFNPDGSEAELSGNGAREAILYLRRRGWTELDELLDPHRRRRRSARRSRAPSPAAWTWAAPASAHATSPRGRPTARPSCASATARPRERITPRARGASSTSRSATRSARSQSRASTSSTRSTCPLIGPPIEGHPEFPNRTNVSWYAELDPGDDAAGTPARIRARIFERGVGETLSSGTGASGAAVAHLLAGAGGRPPGPPSQPARVIVVLDGGELEVEVGQDLRVHLSGWALPVFAGTLSEPFVEELHQINYDS